MTDKHNKEFYGTEFH